MRLRSGGDVRQFVLARRGGRFHRRPASTRRARCGTLRSFRLGLPVFGGTRRRKLAVSYRLGSARTARVTVLRGKRVVRRLKARSRRAGRTYRVKSRRAGCAAARTACGSRSRAAAGRRSASTLSSKRL